MARLARLVIPGWVHHVTQRGNNRHAIFYSDNERLGYLRLIAEYFPLHGLALVGYDLMTNTPTSRSFLIRRTPSHSAWVECTTIAPAGTTFSTASTDTCGKTASFPVRSSSLNVYRSLTSDAALSLFALLFPDR
jgi:hypothetical protein